MGWQLIRQQRSARVVEAARRMAVVEWFRLPGHPLDRGPRLAGALERHARLAHDAAAPSSIEVLPPAEGLSRLPEAVGAAAAWMKTLEGLLEGPRRALLDGTPPVDGPFLATGDCLMLRRGALPIDRERVRQRLDARIPEQPRLVTELLDRLLWQMGALLLWEAAGADGNPFEPLLAIYEEGLCPLELSPDRALLWVPGA